jgi:hypothetical protein
VNKVEIHIKPIKVFGFDGYQMKVGAVKVTYRSLNDLLLDIARTYEPPSTVIHEGHVKVSVPRKRGGKNQGFSSFVLGLLAGENTLTCATIAENGHKKGDERPLKSYSAALRNLEKAGKVKSVKKSRPFLWYIGK